MTALAAPELHTVERARDLVTAARAGNKSLALLLDVDRGNPLMRETAFGHALYLLNELVAIVEQLTTGNDPAAEVPGT